MFELSFICSLVLSNILVFITHKGCVKQMTAIPDWIAATSTEYI